MTRSFGRSSSPQEEKSPKKHAWQEVKESWYDKVNVSVRQLDIIIALASIGLGITVLFIILEATGVIG